MDSATPSAPRPRLAYLLKKFPRLSETFVLGEILGQEALGADIHVLSRRPADDEARHAMLADLRAPIEVLPQQGALDPLTELFADDGERQLDLEQVRDLVQEMKPYQHPRLSRLMGEALWLRRRTCELGVNHVHVHFATESAVTAHLLHALGGPSYSITAHAKDIYRSTVDKRLLERLIKGSTFTVTVCDANVNWVGSLVGERAMRNVRRLYNGIDLEQFQPPREAREAKHVIGVGRLVAKKGFDVLLRASALLRQQGVEHRLTIIGEGEERPALESLISELGLDGQVDLLGALAQERVLELVRSATLLALPCRIGADGNRDALPTVLLEALATELPVVSTPVTGIPEIVDQGRAGLLVPEDDPAATADAIQRLLGDPDLRRKLASAGRARALEHFDRAGAARTLKTWFDAVTCNAVA